MALAASKTGVAESACTRMSLVMALGWVIARKMVMDKCLMAVGETPQHSERGRWGC